MDTMQLFEGKKKYTMQIIQEWQSRNSARCQRKLKAQQVNMSIPVNLQHHAQFQKPQQRCGSTATWAEIEIPPSDSSFVTQNPCYFYADWVTISMACVCRAWPCWHHKCLLLSQKKPFQNSKIQHWGTQTSSQGRDSNPSVIHTATLSPLTSWSEKKSWKHYEQFPVTTILMFSNN